MKDRKETRYQTPTIQTLKAADLVAAMGPAHAIYGDPTGGGSGSGGGVIGN